jgi:hypothetical protein
MKTLLPIFIAAALHAQTPAVSNAKFETRAVTGDAKTYLQGLSREAGPMWIGYAVESNKSDDNSCCWTDENRGCYLEGDRAYASGSRRIDGGQTGPVKLEGSRTSFVLMRVEHGSVGKIHPLSENCPVDAGGLRFVWLTGVSSDASIGFLSGLILSEGKLADTAVFAISMHAGELADTTLERFASAPEPEKIREKALFWLASARGDRGLRAVEHASETAGSDELREKMMFDFTLSKDPRALDDLIRFAHHDSSTRVRSQALFWLSQKVGQKAAKEIRASIDNDPDTEVKKKAVFALQNLPNHEGVPMLIEVAKNNRNPEVRKQAIFWLGQSGDPRALAYIEQVLER